MFATSLAGLFVSTFLLITGSGLLTVLVPTRAKLDGFGALEVGLVGSSYFFGMLLGTFVAPAVIRRFGYVGAFVGLAGVAALCALGLAANVSALPWMVIRGLTGLVFASLYTVIEGWLAGRSTNANRGRIYALYQIMTFAGAAAGQQMLGLAPVRSGQLFLAAACCYALALVPILAARAEPPQRPREVRLRLVWFARASPIGAAVALGVGAANGSYYALAPVYGLGLGLGPGAIATFLTIVTIGTALAIYPVAALSDRFDRRVVIAAFAGLGAGTEVLLALAGGAGGLVLDGLGAMLGCTSFVLYTMGYAHANDRVEPGLSVIVSSAMLFLYCIGAVAAPIVASLAMATAGVQALFVQNAAVHGGLALFVLWRMTRRSVPARLVGQPVVAAPRAPDGP